MTVKISVANGVAFVEDVPVGVTVQVTDYDVDPSITERDEKGNPCLRYLVWREVGGSPLYRGGPFARVAA
jgi:hypothetical protein